MFLDVMMDIGAIHLKYRVVPFFWQNLTPGTVIEHIGHFLSSVHSH